MSTLKNGLTAVAFLLAACGQAAPGDGSADAKVATPAEKKLDLAGVTIGMSVPQATAVLTSAGWRVERGGGPSWEQDVNNELARQHAAGRNMDFGQNGVGGLTATKGDERLSIDLLSAPAPQLGRVKEVQYTAPSAGRTPEQLMKGLIEKFGPPDRIGATGLSSGGTWCVGGASCAGGRGFGSRTHLLAGLNSLSGGVEIRLSEGADSYEAGAPSCHGRPARRLGLAGRRRTESGALRRRRHAVAANADMVMCDCLGAMSHHLDTRARKEETRMNLEAARTGSGQGCPRDQPSKAGADEASRHLGPLIELYEGIVGVAR